MCLLSGEEGKHRQQQSAWGARDHVCFKKRGRKGMGGWGKSQGWRKNGVNVPWNYLRGEGSLMTEMSL